MQANDLSSDRPDPLSRRASTPADSLPATLRVAYRSLNDPHVPIAGGVLAAIRFGHPATAPAPTHDAALGNSMNGAGLTIDVALDPLQGSPTEELWFAGGPVHSGEWLDPSDPRRRVRFAHDEHYLFAVTELDEREYGGILLTAEHAYAALQAFQQQSAFPHLLRMWNYMDAINEGAGDMERYRQFCVGRGRGLGIPSQSYPSATCVGHQRSTHVLQVFWLGGNVPGLSLENPRQVSAYHYPRVHGPTSPTFARALVAPDRTVLISGTASIVGHVSQHHDDLMEQLEETVRNLGAFSPHASRTRTSASKDLLKVYIRDPAATPQVAERLRQLYPNTEVLFVAADICRSELLLEIEAILGT